MNHLLCVLSATAGLTLSAAHGASLVEVYNYTNGTNIPDGNPTGLADFQGISGSAITEIQEISVTLDISGSFNGDLYATLVHSTGFAVLLNRVGRTGSNAFGYNDDGFLVTLNDLGGFADIHTSTSGGGLLSGVFGSDGRTTDPGSVVELDARLALLTNFVALDANGAWTLFVADLAGGDQHTLNGWSMEITGIPEPGMFSLLFLGAALLLRRKR